MSYIVPIIVMKKENTNAILQTKYFFINSLIKITIIKITLKKLTPNIITYFYYIILLLCLYCEIIINILFSSFSK